MGRSSGSRRAGWAGRGADEWENDGDGEKEKKKIRTVFCFSLFPPWPTPPPRPPRRPPRPPAPVRPPTSSSPSGAGPSSSASTAAPTTGVRAEEREREEGERRRRMPLKEKHTPSHARPARSLTPHRRRAGVLGRLHEHRPGKHRGKGRQQQRARRRSGRRGVDPPHPAPPLFSQPPLLFYLAILVPSRRSTSAAS